MFENQTEACRKIPIYIFSLPAMRDVRDGMLSFPLQQHRLDLHRYQAES
jgi:hypothetical protein